MEQPIVIRFRWTADELLRASGWHFSSHVPSGVSVCTTLHFRTALPLKAHGRIPCLKLFFTCNALQYVSYEPNRRLLCYQTGRPFLEAIKYDENPECGFS